MTLNRFRIACIFVASLSSCSTTQVVEQKAPLPVVPEYVRVPHPAGFDLADLHAMLVNPLAPKAVLGEFADTCDEEFKKLTAVTVHREERQQGATELVTHDPERMHWCFYAKISRLQDVLQSDSTWTVRQKKVIESFEFLSPIANAFMNTYHDSRYLRWAAQYYSKVSEWVFFKKMEPTPESSVLFTTGKREEIEPWVNVQRSESEPDSILKKYGISFQPTVAAAVSPLEPQLQVRSPASVQASELPPAPAKSFIAAPPRALPIQKSFSPETPPSLPSPGELDE